MQRSTLAVTGLAMLLCACAAPDIQPASRVMAPETLGLGDEDTPAIAADWWTVLEDEQLNRIIADALRDNPSLDAAVGRLRLADSLLAGAKARYRPNIAADISEDAQLLSDSYIIPPPYGGSVQSITQGQAGFNWDLDFWNRQASVVGQAGAEKDAARLDHAAARQALVSAVVQTYLEMYRAELQGEIAASIEAERTWARQQIEVLRSSGLVAQDSIHNAQAAEADARQSVVEATAQREVATHALALLAGRGADYYDGIKPAFLNPLKLPDLPQTIPADLLARRPDVLAARARITAASAGREVARKAYYPNINLLGFIGLQSLRMADLFTTDAATAGVGAAIHLPIFAGGALRANYEGATARYDLAVAAYNDLVLQSVRETADVLTWIDGLSRNIKAQDAKLGSLASLRLSDRVRASAGLASRLDTVDNDMRLQAARQRLVELEVARAAAKVRLFTALGGGFSETSPAEEIVKQGLSDER